MPMCCSLNLLDEGSGQKFLANKKRFTIEMHMLNKCRSGETRRERRKYFIAGSDSCFAPFFSYLAQQRGSSVKILFPKIFFPAGASTFSIRMNFPSQKSCGKLSLDWMTPKKISPLLALLKARLSFVVKVRFEL